MSLLMMGGCVMDEPTPPAPDAQSQPDATAPDATIPDIDASGPECLPFAVQDVPCWKYAGVQRIGDQTCAHRWTFEIEDTACVAQTGWSLDGDRYVTDDAGAILDVARPSELPAQSAALDVTFLGSPDFFDRSLCQPDDVCTANPMLPGECRCELRRSQVTVALMLDEQVLQSATSLPDGTAVTQHMASPDVAWNVFRATTAGDGGLPRSVSGLRLEYRARL